MCWSSLWSVWDARCLQMRVHRINCHLPRRYSKRYCTGVAVVYIDFTNLQVSWLILDIPWNCVRYIATNLWNLTRMGSANPMKQQINQYTTIKPQQCFFRGFLLQVLATNHVYDKGHQTKSTNSNPTLVGTTRVQFESDRNKSMR